MPPDDDRPSCLKCSRNSRTSLRRRPRRSSPWLALMARALSPALIEARDGGLLCVRAELSCLNLEISSALPASTASGAPNPFANELATTSSDPSIPYHAGVPAPPAPYGTFGPGPCPKIPRACVSSTTRYPLCAWTSLKYSGNGAARPLPGHNPSVTTTGRNPDPLS